MGADLTPSINFIVELGDEDIKVFLKFMIDHLCNSPRLIIDPPSL